MDKKIIISVFFVLFVFFLIGVSITGHSIFSWLFGEGEQNSQATESSLTELFGSNNLLNQLSIRQNPSTCDPAFSGYCGTNKIQSTSAETRVHCGGDTERKCESGLKKIMKGIVEDALKRCNVEVKYKERGMGHCIEKFKKICDDAGEGCIMKEVKEDKKMGSCVIADCSIIYYENDPLGRIKQECYYYLENSRLKKECSDGFEFSKDNEYTIVCDADDGYWTKELSCEKKTTMPVE